MKNFSTLLLLILSLNLTAQPWRRVSIVSADKDNFYSVQKQFHEFWKDKKVSENEEENAADGGYQQFARWEHFMSERAYPSGKISDPDILIKEYERTKLQRNSSQQIQTANWSFVGPNVVPASGGGAGRINCVAFHPTDSNTMYVGAAGGGVWKTTDGGQTWASTTDQLASISIADIAINPINPDTLYAATGDGYGYEYGAGFWGGTYTAGVMKSTDGGLTWTQSGLLYSQTQTDIIQRLIINPQNPEILLACTRNAIFRTIDAGVNWTQVQSGHFYDMEFNPLNPNTIYAVDNNNVFRSLDGGANFSVYSNAFSTIGRISIAVTPSDTTIMYALTQGASFYLSTNSGQTFTLQPQPPVTLYGYYDCVLAASPVNPQRAVIGGYNMFLTDDGGQTWTPFANQGTGAYVHVDNHTLAFLPGSNTTIFSGNDGGFFKTSNSGTAWNDLSNGIDVKQYYRLSSSQVNPDLYYAGAQDNGTDQLKNAIWSQVYGGDGMDCMTDYNDENTAYVSYQYGAFAVTTDGGQSFTGIAPTTNGDWITPIEQDPANPNTIYIGYTDLYKSPDKGTTWSDISAGVFSGNIQHIAIAPTNNNYIYACNLNEIRKTINSGTSWINIHSGLPFSASMTGIVVSAINPQHVWVTFSGYANGTKVYRSINGGTSWTNVSGTLPNIPVDCIVCQRDSMEELYIGTDFGVYYINDTLTDWVPYQAGLPNVIVDDLEINYTASKLRAATYGRGIWETDLNTTTFFATDAGVKTITSPSGLSCNTTINPVIEIINFGLDTLYTADIKYTVDNGTLLTQSWSGMLAHAQSISVNLSAMTVTGGAHTFTAFTLNPNGSTDANAANDQKTISFIIDTILIPYPVTQGFEIGTFPFPDWRVIGAQSLLSVQPYGGFGTSANSMMADYYAQAGAKSYFTSEKVNLTNSASPVRLDFNVAYAQYSWQYQDTLKVSISTDCGATWSIVYSKSDTTLATAPAITTAYFPAANEWRAESINLNAWIGFPEVIARFELLSGFGNQLYIDDINLHAGTVGVTEAINNSDIYISPNPFADKINIVGENDLIASVILTDISGKTIYELKNIKSHSCQLNTSSLSQGIYFLKINTANGNSIRKVVKQ